MNRRFTPLPGKEELVPNFNTHWLTAIKCLESNHLPVEIQKGFVKYIESTTEYTKKLKWAIKSIYNKKALKQFKKEFDKLLDDYNIALIDPKNHDPITLFSAYTLGACGPDFWTLTSESKYGIIPDTAGLHFDLGHYNRSHRQFQVAIKRWQGMDKNSIQVRAEQAYFYGMATHIATDCVVHQLVNVYAGAYHLLVRDNWHSEHGTAPVKLWNAHNKVEHYWDSYIRYRYLGDTGPVFEKDKMYLDSENWITPLGFPTIETIIKEINKDIEEYKNELTTCGDNKKRQEEITDIIDTKKKLIDDINTDKFKYKIEKPFILPRIFCDRVLAENSDIKPFLYDIVVNKESGAYETGIIFKGAIDESTHYQMQGPVLTVVTEVTDKNNKKKKAKKKVQTYNEKKKLTYFSSKNNEDIPNTGFNYLNYVVCPNLSHVKKYGWNDFYHTLSLKPFIDNAADAGKKFISDLASGIKEGDPESIGVLKYFWNLDTGLGLRVKNLPSDTRKEVITELDFIHITEVVGKKFQKIPRDVKMVLAEDQDVIAKNAQNKDNTANDKKLEKSVKSARVVQFKNNPGAPVSAFETYGSKPFESLSDIFETDKNKYLDKIKLKHEEGRTDRDFSIENFFSSVGTGTKTGTNAPTNETTTVQHQDVKHRLSLRIRVPMAELYEKENLGFFMNTDKGSTLTSPKDTSPKGIDLYAWADESLVIDYCETKERDKTVDRFSRSNGLCVFESRLLANLENEKSLDRILEKGTWNNVIPYSPHAGRQYNRNYAIGSGRNNVIIPRSKGDFNGRNHFKMIENLSPTEQVFFTLYPLVQTPEGCFDLFSKEPVDKAQEKNLLKIDNLGMVKIVLYYAYSDNCGAIQAKDCYVDGMKIPVQRVFA